MRWLRVFALFAALTATAAPAAALPIERAVAAEVREAAGDREERSIDRTIVARPLHAAPRVEAREPRTSDHFVLVPELYLRHCALLR